MERSKVTHISKQCKLWAVVAIFVFSFIAGILPSAALDGAGTPDSYENDDTPDNATYIPVSQEPQQHTFHDAGDADWIKFYGTENEEHAIEVSNAGPRCDAVIELYDIDGKSLLERRNDRLEGDDEQIKWLCPKNGIYYIKVSNYDQKVFGEGTAYELSLYFPTAPEGTGVITGTVIDNDTKEFLDGVDVSITAGVTGKSVQGYFLLLAPAGTHTLYAHAYGYLQVKVYQSVKVEAGEIVYQDIVMMPYPPVKPCLAETIFGENSTECRVLRQVRNKVLSGSAAGEKIIRAYYVFSSVIEPYIERNENLKKIMRWFIARAASATEFYFY